MFGLFMDGPSIYKRIVSNTGRKGWLSDGFSLAGGKAVSGSTAPGEAEGMLLHQAEPAELDGEAFERLMELLCGALEGSRRKKEKDIAEYFEKRHVFEVIDRLCEEIYNEERGIDLLKLLDTAYEWATESNNMDLVKLGISLMGMMNLGDREECRKAIVALGKYEEFTLYSLFAVSGWDDAETIAADYALHLKGWGRTHAEEWLEPEETLWGEAPRRGAE